MISDYVKEIQHIGIPTKKMKESVEFYQSLEFKVEFEAETVKFMKIHNILIELYESSQTAGVSGAVDHIALNVEEIDNLYKIINSKGLKILEDNINELPFFKNGVRYFTVEGPNNEKIEFNQII